MNSLVERAVWAGIWGELNKRDYCYCKGDGDFLLMLLFFLLFIYEILHVLLVIRFPNTHDHI